MIASNVMPLDPIIVNIVEESQARLTATIDVLLCIVRLGDLQMTYDDRISFISESLMFYLFLTKVDDQSLAELSLLEQSSCLIQSRTIR